jgi:hypothetical protein
MLRIAGRLSTFGELLRMVRLGSAPTQVLILLSVGNRPRWKRNAIWHVKWADPIAALAVLPLIVWEGREAMRGKVCDCC